MRLKTPSARRLLRRLARARRRATAGLVALALAPSACDSKVASPQSEAADSQAASMGATGSTTKPSSVNDAVTTILTNLRLPTNLGELLAMLKNGAVLQALKQAFAKGTCKGEIQAVVTQGQAMVQGLLKAGLSLPALLGKKTVVGDIDFSSIEPAVAALGQCVVKAAPEVLGAIQAALSSAATGAQKTAGGAEDEGLLTPADVEALDISRWPTSEDELTASERGPAGDPGMPAESP